DDDDDDDSGGGGGGTGAAGGGGGAAPPRAAITTGADCADGLCRARTGTPVTFEDASTGSVRTRTWDLGDDTWPGRNRTVRHAWSEPGFYEVTLRTSNGTGKSTASLTFLVESSDPAGACIADAETLCLQDSRYAVEVDWWTAGSEGGKARVVHAGTNDSGLFWFLDPDNWEVLIKVLDACALNENVWVFSASTTDLGYSIRVTDTVTGVVREYRNEPGLPAPATTDGKAFPGGCQPTTTVDAATPPP
ncbi:MAG: PKD domain-containing protein, partial [Holophagales bacterium]|nr:PKD domain-containing protein [Holophagales bacterium]